MIVEGKVSNMRKNRPAVDNEGAVSHLESSEATVQTDSPKKMKKMKKRKRHSVVEPAETSEDSPKTAEDDDFDDVDSKKQSRKRKKLAGDSSDNVADSTGEQVDYTKVPPPSDTAKPEPKTKKGGTVPKPKDPILEGRTVFVGNLPLKVARNKLRKVFRPYGEIESVRLRSAPRLDARKPARMSVIKHRFHEDRSSMNGYVRFKETSAALAAAQANGLVFEEHHLRVNLASSQSRPDPRCAVFVGGLSLSAEDDQLWRTFESCGDIVSVRVIRDATTSIGKGFGYVNFGSEEAARLALKLNETVLEGQTIRVQRCHATAHKKVDVFTGRKLRRDCDGAEKREKKQNWLAPLSKFSGEAVAESKSSLKKPKKKKKERWDETQKKHRDLAQSLSRTIAPVPTPKPAPDAALPPMNTGSTAPQNKKITFNFEDGSAGAREDKKKDGAKLKELKIKKEAKRKKKSKAMGAKQRRAISEPLSNLLPK